MNWGALVRLRLREWRTSAAFVLVIGMAVALAGAWLAVANPLLRGSLPFPDPEQIWAIETERQGERRGLSWTDMEDLRTASVESVAGFIPRTWGLQTERQGHVDVVLSQQVTPEFFRTLSVPIALGEPLTDRHLEPGGHGSVWLSHQVWQRFFGGSPAALRRIVWLNNEPFRVAGVLPASFSFPFRGQTADVYIPLPRREYWGARGPGGMGVIARLRVGIGRKRFQSELAARSQALSAEHPASNRDVHFRELPLGPFLLGSQLRQLQWLALSVLGLLLVAAANAGGIWLSQWQRHQRRVSIQLALGASRGRIWSEQVAQAVLLGGTAAVAGILGAISLLALLRATPLFGDYLARLELWSKASVDPLTCAVLVCIALGTSLVSCLLPLLVMPAGGPVATSGTAGRTATGRSSRSLRIALAVTQLTLTGTLVYAAIVVGRNLHSLQHQDRGFRTVEIGVVGIGIPEATYNTDEKLISFHQRAIAEIKRIPGVTGAAGGFSLPASQHQTRFLFDGASLPRNEQPMARIGGASSELLPLLEIPLRRGRAFTESDHWHSPRVVLVNEAFVDRYVSPGTDPVGRQIRVAFYNGFAAKPYTPHEITGVIANTRNRDLVVETEPQIIVSANQMAFEGFQYFVRSPLPASALQKPIQEAIWHVDPQLQRVAVTPLADRLETALASRRITIWILYLFGGLAMLTVGLGLGAGLWASFRERTRELAIRSALGASRLRLAWEAVRWAIYAVLISCALTLPVSIALSRLLVVDALPTRWDAAGWVGSSAVLAALISVAAWAPARRAGSGNLADILRDE